MRDYIILNGVNSNTITGLLISTLPPLTKPKIRTQIEEIDGRDGDIVTKLGYSAYTKSFKIGLYGDFDINAVISYFNSEGTVVFSNESDKYYNYQILDQIDFEKLIRFKTATVKMHVQPFKYPLEEEEIEGEATVINDTGSDITLLNTKEGRPVEIELKPSELTQETTTGKNLFDESQLLNATGWALNSEGYYNGTLGNYYSAFQNGFTFNNEFKNNTQYTITLNAYTTGGTPVIKFEYTDSTSVNLVLSETVPTDYTYTTTEGKTLSKIIGTYGSGGTNTMYIKNLQLEEGTTATNFEKYTGGIPSPNPSYPSDVQVIKGNNTITISNSDNSKQQELPLNLGDLEYCKIGDYEDEFQHIGDTWYLNKNIGKVVFNGSENWTQRTNSGGLNQFNYNTGITNYLAQNVSGFQKCNYGIYRYNTYNTGAVGTFIFNSIFSINVPSDLILTQFKQNLENENLICYYPLATPTQIEITDTDLIAQLDAIETATAYDDATHIVANGDKPFILNVTTTIPFEITANNVGNIYAKPLMTINGSGDIGVYLNGVQVLEIALGDNTSITIDVSKMEAYNPSTQALMNRLVTGDYLNFLINSGENTISFSGNVTSFTMNNYTRWL